MKKIIYLVAICLVFVACDRDESKISLSPDGVKTLEVTDITSTSAKISGYFNFYKIVGDMFANDYDNVDIDDNKEVKNDNSFYVKKDSIDLFLGLLGLKKGTDYNIPSNCPDSVMIETIYTDVEYYGVAAMYDTRRDFYNMKYVVVTTERKAGSFSVTLRNLSPNTTYYYKTIIQLRPNVLLSCGTLGLYKKKIYETDDVMNDDMVYNIYGDTKEFKTLP